MQDWKMGGEEEVWQEEEMEIKTAVFICRES